MRTKQVIKTEIESDIYYMFFDNSIRQILKDNKEFPIAGIYYNEGVIYTLYYEQDYPEGFREGRGAREYYMLNGLVSTVNLYSEKLGFELKNSDYLLRITPEEKKQTEVEAQKIREGIILYEPEPELPLSSLIYGKWAVKLSKEEKEEINNFVRLMSLYDETLAVHLSVTYQGENPRIHLSIVLSKDSNEVLNEIIKRYQQSSNRIIFEKLVTNIDMRQLSELAKRDLLTLYDKNGILTVNCATQAEENTLTIPIINASELYGSIPQHYKTLHK